MIYMQNKYVRGNPKLETKIINFPFLSLFLHFFLQTKDPGGKKDLNDKIHRNSARTEWYDKTSNIKTTCTAKILWGEPLKYRKVGKL